MTDADTRSAVPTPTADEPPPPNKVKPRRSWASVVAAIVLVAIVVRLAFSVFGNDNVDWKIVLVFIGDYTILKGLAITVVLSVLAQTIGVLLGVLLAVMRMSDNAVLRTIAFAYIWAFRGTPVLVQLLLWYNLALWFPHIALGVPGGPSLSWDTNTIMTSFVAALFGLALNEGAYMAEIVRAGMLSVDSGQREASIALGMTPAKATRKIVLPQAMRVIIPPTGNDFIALLKTTSLVLVIAGGELLTKSLDYAYANSLTIEFLLVASFWYLVLTTVASFGQMHIERVFNRGHEHREPAWRSVFGRVFRVRRERSV